jgi:hypothetical protein
MNEYSIPKVPDLTPAEDYFFLRATGVAFIEAMGKKLWTDYNTHDPGITILESLCYAITDLGYRTGWSINDLLAGATDQGFFTAREILTVNPWTPNDFRRLLIDLEGVRNAWVICKQCDCGVSIEGIAPRGLYDVLLELESDAELGDLNDRKIVRTMRIDDAGTPREITIEMRFPEWSLAEQSAYDAFVASTDDPLTITRGKFSRSSTALNVVTNDELRRYWNELFYVTLSVALGAETVEMRNVTLRFYGDTAAKNAATVAAITAELTGGESDGALQTYRAKLVRIASDVAAAADALQEHRNLDEDYCSVAIVGVEEVAACADVQVADDADIERVQAEIWFRIEEYLNPPVPFYSLEEMQSRGVAVEEIFNGPQLSNGFITDEDLAASTLRRVVRASDIVNLLMDIDGVVAISNLLLTKYDAAGNAVRGVADPVFAPNAIFDANKLSASWLLYISEGHQPRLYHNRSNFHFYKNGLPFTARQDEAYDTLTQLRGESERPRIANGTIDLPVPGGRTRAVEEITPIQYGFPLTYGIGPDHLPTHVSDERRAQARQLKAYLMIFEQLVANGFAQLAHFADLFALRTSTDRTYFHHWFDPVAGGPIDGLDVIAPGLTEEALAAMLETPTELIDRRNLFLDHMMARFGEQFGEYALLLTNWKGEAVGGARLIDDKVGFLNAYPEISRDRARSFDYTTDPCDRDNMPVIKKRVSLLLGFPNLAFAWTTSGADPGPFTTEGYVLADGNGVVWLEGTVSFTEATAYESRMAAYDTIIARLTLPSAYRLTAEADGLRLSIVDEADVTIGEHPTLLTTTDDAQELMEELVAWSSYERSIVVEHLLLRPKFPGDAMMPSCDAATPDAGCSCASCSDDDPYSFRLTFVMPGWAAPYNENLDLRSFANRTIQQETPSHLLPKICWVGNDGFIEDPCDPIVREITRLLQESGVTTDGATPTCEQATACAEAAYALFADAFATWYATRTLEHFEPDALTAALTAVFAAIAPADVACAIDMTSLWGEITAKLLVHFTDIVRFGWQFERFENAWCLWLEANSAIDWMSQRLAERVEAILVDGGVTAEGSGLCACAETILTAYGASFRQWMDDNLAAGTPFEEFTPFVPAPITACDGVVVPPEVITAIEEMLLERYGSYAEVSYRLWRVVSLLAGLRNAYPAATLHDCDDGSDLNPVRLGSTALGSLALRSTSMPTLEVSPADRTNPTPPTDTPS